LERLIVPWTTWPGSVVIGAPVQVTTDELVPAGTVVEPVAAEVAPDREQDTTAAPALPVFLRVTAHAESAALFATHCTPIAVTLAFPERVPKSPNEKPAMDTPDTSVIAIRMTVARTGEIALLLPNGPPFILDL